MQHAPRDPAPELRRDAERRHLIPSGPHVAARVGEQQMKREAFCGERERSPEHRFHAEMCGSVAEGLRRDGHRVDDQLRFRPRPTELPGGLPGEPLRQILRLRVDAVYLERKNGDAPHRSSGTCFSRIPRTSRSSGRRFSASRTYFSELGMCTRKDGFFFTRSMKTKRPASLSLRCTVRRSKKATNSFASSRGPPSASNLSRYRESMASISGRSSST